MLTRITWLLLLFLSLYSMCSKGSKSKPHSVIQQAFIGTGHYNEIRKGLDEIKGLISDNKGRKRCWRMRNRAIKNVALGKKTIDTSQYNNHNHKTANALNGVLNDIFSTKLETYPAFRVDLDGMYHIFEVEIYNRIDGYTDRFRDVDIRVGRTMNDLNLCGHHKGPSTKGERVIIRCHKVMTGRFVELKINKHKTYLSFAEVMVWGTKI